MTDRMDDLLRKIRALKAKAERTNNEHEAAAFAAKVQELLLQYNLDESVLDVKEEKVEVGHERHQEREWDKSPWRKQLVNAVMHLYMCRVIAPGYKNGPWVVIGKRHNVIVAKEMIQYLFDTTVRLSNAWSRDNPLGDRIDFRRGCFSRLVERVWELKRQQEKQAAAQSASSNLPSVYVNETRLSAAYLSANFSTKRTSFRGRASGNGYHDGKAAGDRVSLSPQIGGGSRATHLIGSK